MIAESHVEEAALAWLAALGYSVRYGPGIAAGEPASERTDPNCRDAILEHRLRRALTRLNTDLPADALDDAYRKLIRTDAPSLVERNRARIACWSMACRSSIDAPTDRSRARRPA